jgi:hypothetical protein
MKVRPPGYTSFEDFSSYRYLYYPGASLDASAIINLADRLDINVVVYADYIIEINQLDLLIERLEEKNFRASSRVDLNPEFLNPELKNWESYWHADQEAQSYRAITDPWGKLIPLRTPRKKNIFLVYLHTEAIKTNALLCKYWGPAEAVVIQDQGAANYWTPFGGDSEMYFSARINKKLSEYIYLERNTTPWPNYVQYSEFEECFDTYGSPGLKALFRKAK